MFQYTEVTLTLVFYQNALIFNITSTYVYIEESKVKQILLSKPDSFKLFIKILLNFSQ